MASPTASTASTASTAVVQLFQSLIERFCHNHRMRSLFGCAVRRPRKRPRLPLPNTRGRKKPSRNQNPRAMVANTHAARAYTSLSSSNPISRRYPRKAPKIRPPPRTYQFLLLAAQYATTRIGRSGAWFDCSCACAQNDHRWTQRP